MLKGGCHNPNINLNSLSWGLGILCPRYLRDISHGNSKLQHKYTIVFENDEEITLISSFGN